MRVQPKKRLEICAEVLRMVMRSRVWMESEDVKVVYLSMLTNMELNYEVRGSVFNIACWSFPADSKQFSAEQRAMAALEILSAPDRNRVEPQENDGRLVQEIEEDGWMMLGMEKLEGKQNL